MLFCGLFFRLRLHGIPVVDGSLAYRRQAGAADPHLAGERHLNAMLLQHDKEIALLKLQVGLRTRTPEAETSPSATASHTAPAAAPRLALTPHPTETP